MTVMTVTVEFDTDILPEDIDYARIFITSADGKMTYLPVRVNGVSKKPQKKRRK